MLVDALASLTEALGNERIKRDEQLARYTTFKIGGPADLFFVARTTDELVAAVSAARMRGVPYFVIGTGANVLIGDRGFRGLVIKNEAQRIATLGEGLVYAESGATMADMIAYARDRGLSGLEHYAGIPSSVGGALWQNLHFLSPDRTRTVFIEECLAGAKILTEAGLVEEVDVGFFRFGYDDSILHHSQELVLSASFRLIPAEKTEITSVIDANLAWRQEHHPDLRAFPSAGSIFKKIEGAGAGRLIDHCGLKGRLIGGAQISPRHANFIVNLGGATAKDVLALVALCQSSVQARFGLSLAMEVGWVGET